MHAGAGGQHLWTASDQASDVAGVRNRRFGESVAFGPDLDGDGIGELLIAAPSQSAGSIEIHSGRDGTWLRRLRSTDESARAGAMIWVVGDAGDVDGDGYRDVFGVEPDRSVLVFSGRTMELVRQISLRTHVLYSLGSTADAIGDADGDGCADLALGANETWKEVFDAGLAHIRSADSGELLWAPERSEGIDVCGAGDVDGDGSADIALHLVESESVEIHSLRYAGASVRVLLDR